MGSNPAAPTTYRGRVRRWAPAGLAALFVASGTLHLVRPASFFALLPDVLPGRDAIIGLTGVAELVCAWGLLAKTRWAGPASAMLLVAVFPGNVWFAVAALADPASPPLQVALAWARLPLQAPLIWAALQARRAEPLHPPDS